MTPEELTNHISRTIGFLNAIDPNAPRAALERDLRNIASAFTDFADSYAVDDGGDGGGGVPSIVFPVWPGRPQDEHVYVEPLITDLRGRSLPVRPQVAFNMSLTGAYGLVLNGTVLNRMGGRVSHVNSSCIMLYGTSAILNAVLCASGGDAIKLDNRYGPVNGVIRGCHIFGLAMAAGAHGDGIQGRGGIERLLVEDTFFDLRSGESFGPNGSWINSCMIFDNSLGGNETIYTNRTIFDGGNYAIMTANKGTSHTLPKYVHKAAAFIVRDNSPQFGLLTPGTESLHTFDDDCAVYLVNASGVCEFVTADVAGYNESLN